MLGTVEEALIAAVRDEHPFLRTVPLEEIASVAARRWASYERRHPKAPSQDDRIRDLAKGLRDHFAADPSLGGGGVLREYEQLARRLVPLFQGS
jgi:hypothetical protein